LTDPVPPVALRPVAAPVAPEPLAPAALPPVLPAPPPPAPPPELCANASAEDAVKNASVSSVVVFMTGTVCETLQING
jgi:hypothetical protein